uniref:Lipoxygenase homology domain-containing protein 1-like n=1 Tax=Saccoglossus kowalevskii TaxID=10224 RepID=A0ABM0MC96_SACKO
RLIDVGKISKIRLLHNNTNPDPRWRVDYLTMEDKHTGEKLEFNFDCWIGVNDGDGTACKEAPALRENDEPLNVHEYVLEVYTGEKDESGTDADVFVIIGGSKGDTGRRDLRKPTTENEEKFQKGQMDAFVIDAVNLGMVGGISVGIDSDDIDKKWYLDKIVLKDSKDEDAKVTEFKCQKWFGDNETFVTFYPEAKLKCVVHSSEKSEGNLNGSKVYVAAFMYSEDTGFTVSDHVVLDNGQDDMFSANKVDEFEANFGAINLMDVYKIRGWLDDDDVQPNEAGQKKCPSLHFKSICMKSDGQEFSYEVNKWLSKTEDDCETVRELPIIRTQPDTLPVSSYLITVFTYEDAESGTDADIYINIIGSLGDTGKRWLCKPISGGEKFDQPGKKQYPLGSLQKITIFKSPGKAWFVDKLVIKEGLAAEQETEFKCVRNLGYDNPDETIEETFDLSEVRESSKIVVPLPEEPTESQGEWKVYVTTNKDENAGTEAKVTFIAYGTEGVILGNIGRIYKIRLQSDNSGKNPSWFLEK